MMVFLLALSTSSFLRIAATITPVGNFASNIVWPIKLDVSRAQTLIKHIELNLGRIYRHYLNEGSVNINFLVYRDKGGKLQKTHDLCRPIRVFDPMFLMANTCLPGEYGKIATNDPWGGKDGNGEDIVTVDEIIEGEKIIHEIKIRYSIAKPQIQDLGGASDLGKLLAQIPGFGYCLELIHVQLGSYLSKDNILRL